jgi:hypothetical protein
MDGRDQATIDFRLGAGQDAREMINTGYDLYVQEEGAQERRIPFCYSQMTIGSADGKRRNDIVIESLGVNNRQGMFTFLQGQIFYTVCLAALVSGGLKSHWSSGKGDHIQTRG